MRFQHELVYDAAPGEVYAMLTTQAFREEVCEYQQVLRYSVAIDETDEGLSVDVDQVQAMRGPATSVRKFVGDEIEIEQRETWRSPTDAVLEVSIPGKPGRMSGAITLRERDGQTVERVEGEIKVGVPLIGRKIEEMVAQVFRYALHAENAVGERWLTSAD